MFHPYSKAQRASTGITDLEGYESKLFRGRQPPLALAAHFSEEDSQSSEAQAVFHLRHGGMSTSSARRGFHDVLAGVLVSENFRRLWRGSRVDGRDRKAGAGGGGGVKR